MLAPHPTLQKAKGKGETLSGTTGLSTDPSQLKLSSLLARCKLQVREIFELQKLFETVLTNLNQSSLVDLNVCKISENCFISLFKTFGLNQYRMYKFPVEYKMINLHEFL